MSRRYVGYFFSIAFVPSLSLSAYLSMLFASIESCGFSLAKGSGRRAGFLGSKVAGGVMAPVHSGMVPSLLPAFSAPQGVRVEPSALISSGVAAAAAVPARVAPIMVGITLMLRAISMSPVLL